MCLSLLERTRPKEIHYAEFKPFREEDSSHKRVWVKIKPSEIIKGILVRGPISSKGFSLI